MTPQILLPKRRLTTPVLYSTIVLTHEKDETKCTFFFSAHYLVTECKYTACVLPACLTSMQLQLGGLTGCLLLHIEETLLYCRLIRIQPVPQHALQSQEESQRMIAAS